MTLYIYFTYEVHVYIDNDIIDSRAQETKRRNMNCNRKIFKENLLEILTVFCNIVSGHSVLCFIYLHKCGIHEEQNLMRKTENSFGCIIIVSVGII